MDKIQFHKTFPGIAGDFEPEKCQKHILNLKPEKKLELVTAMMDLQQSIYLVTSKILLIHRPIEEMIASALVNFVLEAFNLYTLETMLLKKLVQGTYSSFQANPTTYFTRMHKINQYERIG